MKSIATNCFAGLQALLLLILYWPAAAQAPDWQSAQAVAVATTAATATSSVVTASAVDASGNVYLAGYFTSTVRLGSTTLTSLGDTDGFVAKFSTASNQFAWAVRVGSTQYEAAYGLVVSGTSLYVTGDFASPTVSFGATTLSNAGSSNDIFVAKLTDAGSFVWALRAGGSDNEHADALAATGNAIYLAGYFGSSSATFGTNTLYNAGPFPTTDLCVAKLLDAGNTGSFAWVQRAGGTGDEVCNSMAVSGSDVYVGGYFRSSTASFGASTLSTTSGSDAFVAKLTDAGITSSFAWAVQSGGTGDEAVNALAVNGASIYALGIFRGATASFGTATLTNAGAANSTDIFVAKLTDAGNSGRFGWAQRAGGTNNDLGMAVTVSGADVYAAGQFNSSTASFGTTTLVNAGSSSGADVFVAKLTDAGGTGSFAWAQRAGGADHDQVYALVSSGASIYVAGCFGGPAANFGTITLSNTTANTQLGFLATLTDATLTAATPGRTLSPVRRYAAPATAEATLDLRGLPAGLYLLHGAGPAQRLLVE